MEASALQHQAALGALGGRSPLLRLQSDERLVALTRRGHNGAFEALVQRYSPRLLAFCRHMLGSREDAEDVLQEVLAASYNALLADDRPINARPWLYRIARNRCLNHLRKPRASGQDSMDVFERDNGTSTAETVHCREEFRQIVADVGHLPESQRTALLLREIDALSYDQIADAMDTTVPSVKSLLVRARVSLAEASEARLLTCEEVRLELGQVAEGLLRSSAPARRHLKGCDRCRLFRSELRTTSKALAAVYPIGPLIFLKKLGLAKLGLGGGSAASSAAAGGAGGTVAAGGGIAATGAATAAGGAAAGGAISAGIGTLASKTAAGMAAAVIVTAGAVEVRHVTKSNATAPPPVAATPAPPPAKPAPADEPPAAKRRVARTARVSKPDVVAVKPAEPVEQPEPAAPKPAPNVQEEQATTTLPPRTGADGTTPPGEPAATAPGEPTAAPEQPPAPPAGEPSPVPAPPPPPAP